MTFDGDAAKLSIEGPGLGDCVLKRIV